MNVMHLRSILFFVATLPLLVLASSVTANDTIHACAHKNSGDLRVVSAPGQCLKSEYELSWTDGQNYDQRINELLGRVAAIEAALGVINEAPVVSAGDDQTILLSMAAALTGIAEDDGLLQPLSYAWFESSTVGGVSFTHPGSLLTDVYFAAPGTYDLTLEVYDGAVTISDVLQITVYPDNAPPTIVTAGTQIVAAERLQVGGRWTLRCADIELDATVTDDGLPLPLTYNWEVGSTYAPRVSTYPCSNYPNLQVTTGFSSEPSDSIAWPFNIAVSPHAAVNYERCVPNYVTGSVSLSVSDGYFSADDTLSVRCDVSASEIPTVDAGVDQSFTGYNTGGYGSYYCNAIQLAATAEDDGLPKPLYIEWTQVSRTPVPTYWSAYVLLGDANALGTTVAAYVRTSTPYAPPPPDQVTFTLQVRAYDGYRNAIDTVDITCAKPN